MDIAPPGDVFVCTSLDRELPRGPRRRFQSIVAHIEPDPCQFRPYCRWLVDRLAVEHPIDGVEWPPEVEDEDFIEVHVRFADGHQLTLSLDRWLGIALADVEVSAAGDDVFRWIEAVHQAAPPERQAAASPFADKRPNIVEKLLGTLVLGGGMLLSFFGVVLLPVAAFAAHLELLLLGAVFCLALMILFGGWIVAIWRGRTRTDGSHISPYLWFILGLATALLPIGGFFTGHYARWGSAAAVQAVVYVVIGVVAMRSSLTRIRLRRLLRRSTGN